MPTVVINEFEIVAEPPSNEPVPPAEPQQAPPAQFVPTPHDIIAIERHNARRLARVRAD
jgi:hypothetical protein